MPDKNNAEEKEWELRLYVAGQTAKSISALANLKQICDEHLEGKYHIEIIDLLKQPQLSRDDQIIATPTLIRKLPKPIRKIIKNLSNNDKVLVALDIKPRSTQFSGGVL